MINISKIGESLVFDDGGLQTIVPIDKVEMVAIADSKSLSVRLMGSRKPLVQFNYDETNLGASSASNLIDKIINLN